MDAFALGAFISRYPIPKAKTQFFLLAVLIPAVGFASQYVATGSIGAISALGYPLLLPDAYQFLWAYSLLNYFFAVIIYGVAQEGWLTRYLEWRPLRYLGKISYGLYVYHFPIVWFAGRLTDLGVSEPILKPLVAILAFCGTLLIASLSFRFLERPITNLKDRWFPLKPSSEPEKTVSLAVE
jgi:peptidoglycan/LPS O-acetylase OafA/YrhL